MPDNNPATTEYLAKIGRPIEMRVLTAGQAWKQRQTLQYHAVYNDLRQDFTHLKDFKNFLGTYTLQLHGILKYILFKVIAPIILRGIEALRAIISDSILGQISKGLRQFGNIAGAFGFNAGGIENVDDVIQRAQSRLGDL